LNYIILPPISTFPPSFGNGLHHVHHTEETKHDHADVQPGRYQFVPQQPPNVVQIPHPQHPPPPPQNIPPQPQHGVRIFQVNINLAEIAKFLFFVFIFSRDGNVSSIFFSIFLFFGFKFIIAYFNGRNGIDLNEEGQDNEQDGDDTINQDDMVPFDDQANWGMIEHIERFLFGLFASLLPSWNPRVVPAHEHQD